ncbi:MAG: 2OG-Fe(II) oxygenase [Hyphomicrobiaceae bacterium]
MAQQQGTSRLPAPASPKSRYDDVPVSSLQLRIENCDWPTIDAELDDYGAGRLGRLLTPAECQTLVDLYDRDDTFRTTVNMARHGFGRGEYKYFAHPLPALITTLRTQVYSHAARTANRWAELLGSDITYPARHADMLARCHAAGQTRPTPLLLRYDAGDYNCLHQDVYGAHVFPLQLVILLSDPAGFRGGEFVITEQRPRMQSRVEVVPLRQGEAALFAVNERPRRGTKGYHRVKLRHGVSRLHTGRRHTAGIIFHDAN